jgi:hypothetical protein
MKPQVAKRSSWKERSWAQEFGRVWHALELSRGRRELQLLRDVAFVHTPGRQLLREIYQQTNARFLADSPLTRYFAEDAMQHPQKDGEKGA